MVSIKMKEGRTTAKVAMTDPTTLPVEVNPTYVAALIPIGPGVIWLIATISVNSCELTHP